MKYIYKKSLVISIILLLIGFSVSSAISVDTKSPVVNQQRGEDCNYEEINSRHLVRLERQLNRLEVYTKLLLVLSRDNPELREISEELSYLISTFKKSDLKDIICDWLLNMIYSLDNITMDLFNRSLDEWHAGNYINSIILFFRAYPFIVLAEILFKIWESIGCKFPSLS